MRELLVLTACTRCDKAVTRPWTPAAEQGNPDGWARHQVTWSLPVHRDTDISWSIVDLCPECAVLVDEVIAGDRPHRLVDAERLLESWRGTLAQHQGAQDEPFISPEAQADARRLDQCINQLAQAIDAEPF